MPISCTRHFAPKSCQAQKHNDFGVSFSYLHSAKPTGRAWGYMSDLHDLRLVEARGTLKPRDSLCLVKSGNSAPLSGIYRVKHLDSEHEAVLLRGQIVPQCQCCE